MQEGRFSSPGLYSLFSNFRFGSWETGSTFHRDRFAGARMGRRICVKGRTGELRITATFRGVQQASDRKTRDELGQFIDERLVDGDAERLLRK